jgi:hypothetical protein
LENRIGGEKCYRDYFKGDFRGFFFFLGSRLLLMSVLRHMQCISLF